MTTDITELAQSHELLIANGTETANLLRHLANNEIDPDYFAVVSECESYGRETEAELSITDFALRAACYVDELVEALEKARQRICELLPSGGNMLMPPLDGLSRDHLVATLQTAVDKYTALHTRWREDRQRITDLEFIRTSADKVQREFADELGCAGDNESILQAIDDLKKQMESRTVKFPKLKILEDYLAEVAIEERKAILIGVRMEFHRALTAAGIKWEGE